MVSKRKKPLVPKANLATPERLKSPKVDKGRTAESLIRMNGELVEELYKSQVWIEIIKPLLDESIASVSGRYTNGRYWHGGLTTKWDGSNPLFYAAYQKALMDFHNNLHDFVVAKTKLIEETKAAKEEAQAPIVNPFMESDSDN